MPRGTLTATGLSTSKSGVKITKAAESGVSVKPGTASAMKTIYSPPGPRDKPGKAGA